MGKMLIAQNDSITPRHFHWEKRGTLHVIQWILLHNPPTKTRVVDLFLTESNHES